MGHRHGLTRGGLSLVQTNAEPEPYGPRVSFCSHCGARPHVSQPASRVCATCEMGLLLEARTEVAPDPGDPFLVLDGSMSVCAVSAAAERLLCTDETEAVNRHITELLVPAEAEAQGTSNLAVAVTWAARGDHSTSRVFVRPANTFGVRMPVRISSCGPVKAALLVFG